MKPFLQCRIILIQTIFIITDILYENSYLKNPITKLITWNQYWIHNLQDSGNSIFKNDALICNKGYNFFLLQHTSSPPASFRKILEK